MSAPAPSSQQVGPADVSAAAQRLRGVIPATPLERSARLSARTGAEVFCKREDLQVVRSYKVRGAYNFVVQLDNAQRAGGVVTASAGNHAQGLAQACSALDVRGRIYLPRTTPRQKRDRIAALGGTGVDVIVGGNTYDEAAEAARADVAASGAVLVPAFDHPWTIAGQGTVVAEAIEQLGRLPDVVVLPVGGGGLLAGTCAWLARTHPEVRIVGVEPAGAASMGAALQAGRPVALAELDSFVDGAAVRTVGQHTFPLVRDAGVEVVAVPEGQICTEMLAMYQTDGIIAEPAGALAASALGAPVVLEPGSTVLTVVSGGNNDVSRYGEIIERALVHEGRKHYFLVDFPQEPGALRGFLDDVLGPDDDITLFEYTKRNNREFGPALVGIELGHPDDLPALLTRMDQAPPDVRPIPPDDPLFRFLL